MEHDNPKIDDGFGDEKSTNPEEMLVTYREEMPANHPEEYAAMKRLTGEEMTRLRIEQRHLMVDPELANRNRVRHGPILGGVTAAAAETASNLEVLRLWLEGNGFAKHPTVTDRWTSDNGVQVEMGYTHGEVWVRAIDSVSMSPTRDQLGRAPLWTKRIYGWQTAGSNATLREVFLDLLALARSDRQARGHEVTRGRALGFALLHPGARLPDRTYPDDAGFDLYVSEDTTIKPGKFVDVPMGVSVGLPFGVWGRITGRSSTLRNRGLLVNEGIIDTGYTGPLFAGCQNMTSANVYVMEGDRLAQLILHTNISAKYEAVAVDAHPQTERGEAGFGSSGQ